jgi:hypothetical protein
MRNSVAAGIAAFDLPTLITTFSECLIRAFKRPSLLPPAAYATAKDTYAAPNRPTARLSEAIQLPNRWLARWSQQPERYTNGNLPLGKGFHDRVSIS